MGLEAQTFDGIKKLAQEAAPKLIDVGNPKLFAYMDKEGKILIGEKPLPNRIPKSESFDIPSVTRYVIENTEKNQFAAEIWYSRNGIYGYCDRNRREWVKMIFTPTKPFDQLNEWDSEPAFITQKELYLSLRTTFLGTYQESIATAVKKISWNNGSTTNSEVTTGARSISKDIQAKLVGVVDMPEYCTFTVPIFEELPALKATIQVYIQPNPETENFKLIPIGGEIEKAYRAAEAEMERLIALNKGEGQIRVYYGSPTDGE